MVDPADVGEFLTIVVMSLVTITLGISMIRFAINTNVETGSQLIVAAAVNWWVPIAETAPLVFVALLFLFAWADVEELLEL